MNYWTRKLDRRRLLARSALGGAAVAGMAVVGCSGDDDAGTTAKGTASAGASLAAPSTPTDGGTLRLPQTTEPSGLDPVATINITSQFVADGVYSRLVRFKEGGLPDVQKLELAPDLATSWESTPDLTQWRFTLRPGVLFHAKPPVNGRALTTDDVVKSVDRVNSQPGVYKSYLRDIDKIETPDDRTIVFKLKRANGLFGSTLANFGVLRVMPREAASAGFDPKTMMIGSGPWQFDSYEPTRQLTFKRVETHWTRPHFDTLIVPIIASLSQQIGRMATGEIDLVQRVALQADAALARGSKLQESVPYYANTTRIVVFEGQTSRSDAYGAGSPLLDDRVRRAMSMAMNREATAKALNIASPTFVLDNYVPAGLRAWWLDPQGAEIGKEAAAVFKYDPKEAKALLSAAGLASGFETTLHFSASYPESYQSRAQAYANQWREIGVKVNLDSQEYNTFLSTTFAGKSKGMGFILKGYFSGLEACDAGLYSSASSNYGAVNDPDIDKLVDRAYAAPMEEAIKLVKQIQDLANRKSYYAPSEPDVNVDFAPPTLGGFKEYFGGTATTLSEAAPFYYRKKA